MSLWQFNQIFKGWRRANGVKDAPPAPTEEDFLNADWSFGER